MHKNQEIHISEDNDIKRVFELFVRHYKLFSICLLISLFTAFLINRNASPVYKASSSLLIKEQSVSRSTSGDMNDFINSEMFGIDQNFENELWVLKSSPVIERTLINLELPISYYKRKGFTYLDAYKNSPIKVLLLSNHVQPVNVRFQVSIIDSNRFIIKAKSKNVPFRNFETDETAYYKENWFFQQEGNFGKLIETPDLAFVIHKDSIRDKIQNGFIYGFILNDVGSLTNAYKQKLDFKVVQREATVIEISLKSHSSLKAIDFVNELMNVYSQQNLDRKNHLANITIGYIEDQLDEISDSLNRAENSLQKFRSSRQLVNFTEQADAISVEYRNLQNQLAELTTRKRYYDDVAEFLNTHEDYSEMIVPASIGIQDQLLNNLISELISAQAQRTMLIKNNQERNPLVQKLTIQIENTRKTISENIAAVRKTTDISLEEMNKRIQRIEAEIGRLPGTQRQLGGIERKYKLNDAIYNFLLEKRAEAKIAQASNLPDNIIIEPAGLVGNGPIAPNRRRNYALAFILGISIPLGFFLLQRILNNKLTPQDNIQKLTNAPVLGKILHNRKTTDNVVFEYPNSVISECYRALRTNIEFHFKDSSYKTILVTSSTEGEGKTFSALNMAMSYALLNRKTILVDLDLRKPTSYFLKDKSSDGLSSYLSDRSSLEDIISKSPHEMLDYIPSGPVPPNPIELLASGKLKDLIDQLKMNYDCVVIDSSPLGQVSDGYYLIHHADIIILVARYNYTHKKIFSLIMSDLKNKNINNVSVLLNDNRAFSDQYGYGYGYKQKKHLFDFIKFNERPLFKNRKE